MPLTEFQAATLRLLAAHRSPESYLAGGTVLNAANDSPRYSKDLDIFHDIQTSVAASAETDALAMRRAGYNVEFLLRQPAFQRAEVSKDRNRLLIEWLFDSAFRFFPVERDELTGWRLNPYDAATNKLLALVGRGEPRDYLDVLHFHQHRLTLSALCWAAAGKDPGLNPFMILQECQRTTRFRPEQFAELELAAPLDLPAWKRTWMEASRLAETLLERLPAEEIGCLYLDAAGNPVTPDPSAPEFRQLTRHYGKVGGAWPTVLTC
jgi:hypothetical protein